ncbi:MAG: hypothetical protein WAT77_12510 [Paracoccaceae bacterium]|jgi:ribonuclease BN (tRNA processing enzyme)
MPDPTQATLFAYQVGFGDCFLLRIGYDDGSARHVLFDFGTTSLPEGAAKDHMVRVARDIEARCNGKLDMLVATHRHADHISGFATSGNPAKPGPGDIIAALTPSLVVQPWTEAPSAPIDWTGPKGIARAKGFSNHVNALLSMQKTAENSLAFLKFAGKRVPPAVASQIAFIGEDNLANLSSVSNLQAMGKKTRAEFVFHGCKLDVSNELPGVTIDILGPPTLLQSDSIRTQASSNKDEFWMLAAKRMGDAAGAGVKTPLFPNARSRPGSRMLVEYRWLQRRLDAAQAELTLGLVRALDDQMNNTSVIMVMRFAGKTLLFPGDAQWENWHYALQSPLAALLDDVDFYKVGHHGSRNATPKSMWKKLANKGPASKPRRLTSVVSTKQGKHGTESKHTEVPRKSLMAELREQSNLHTTEALAPNSLYEEIQI